MAYEPVRDDLRGNQVRHVGGAAWAVLALYVIVYDIAAGALKIPTLSAVFHKASTAPRKRFLLLAFWLYLTGHLFRWIPPRWDLFRNLHKPLAKNQWRSLDWFHPAT